VRSRITALRGSLAERPPERAQLAALRIDAEPGARIVLDGEPLGLSPIERIVWIEPGQHSLEAQLPGRVPFRAEIGAPAGAMVAGNVELLRRSNGPSYDRHGASTLSPLGSRQGSSRARASETNRGASVPAWVASGTSVAAAIASVVAGASAESSRSAGDLDAADTASSVASVALVSALASGVLAAVLFLAVPNHAESSAVLQ